MLQQLSASQDVSVLDNISENEFSTSLGTVLLFMDVVFMLGCLLSTVGVWFILRNSMIELAKDDVQKVTAVSIVPQSPIKATRNMKRKSTLSITTVERVMFNATALRAETQHELSIMAKHRKLEQRRNCASQRLQQRLKSRELLSSDGTIRAPQVLSNQAASPAEQQICGKLGSKGIEHTKKMFHKMDAKGTGSLSTTTMKQLLRVKVPANEVDSIFSRIDTTGNGLITLDEFVSWVHGKEEVDGVGEIRSLPIVRAQKTLGISSKKRASQISLDFEKVQRASASASAQLVNNQKQARAKIKGLLAVRLAKK